MKRSFLILAFVGLSAMVSAQTMKVQSAYSDMKNGRLLNAKQNIDDALKDDKTGKEAKTWNYAGVIYTQIVQAMEDESTDKKTKKELKKITESKEELCNKGLDFLKQCIQMDEKKEYTSSSIGAIKVLCGFAYMYAGKDYNDQKYEVAVNKFHSLAETAVIANYNEIAMDAKYYEADCYRMMKQNDKEMELYRELAKMNTTKGDVYLKIYAANMNDKDTNKAINALKKGVRLTAKDKNMNIKLKSTLAQTYIWTGKSDEADKIIDELLAGNENNIAALNSVANIYVDLENVQKAEELFNKSIQIDSKQIDAYKGLGILNFNQAVAENTAADKLPPDPKFDEEYNAHKKASFAFFEKSEPFFKEVLSRNENDFDSLKALKTVYAQLASRSDSDAQTKAAYKEKYQQVSAKLQTLLQ
ncbi:MAG: hypothetical protein IJ748_06980 [Bacteroidales bacterium]|nr:hypothetical protein [Bacteroidales bacterium]